MDSRAAPPQQAGGLELVVEAPRSGMSHTGLASAARRGDRSLSLSVDSENEETAYVTRHRLDEVFDSQGDGVVTLGEHFFVQLKSHSAVKWVRKDVYGRGNVEKLPLKYDRRWSSRMQMIAEPLETAELQLARSMGPATPLALVVADTTHSKVHWVCLNDFVDKVLVPGAGPDLSFQASHTVHLPHFNRIGPTNDALIPLRFLARRGKLYSAFNRFRYQRHEIQYALDQWATGVAHQLDDADLLRRADHFLRTVLAYDFWTTTHAWPVIALTHIRAKTTASMITQAIAGASFRSILAHRLQSQDASMSGESKDELLRFLFVSDIHSTFEQLANLGNLFEEICREWSLPTYFGMLARGDVPEGC